MSTSHSLTVLAFGIARDIIGADQCVLSVPAGTTVDGLRQLIRVTYPGFTAVADFAIARNATYAGGGGNRTADG